MKKLCKPILIESKEYNQLRLDNNSKLSFEPNIKGLNYAGLIHKYQQLILISLDENEKIEIGDIIYSEILNEIEVLKEMPKGDLKFWFDGIYKVITTQEQLSPEYIQQFIEEYNRGEVKDVEVKYVDNGHEDWIGDDYNGEPFWNEKLEPKLTNGFVTITSKEENITYTEEEVYELLRSFRRDVLPFGQIVDFELNNWFNNNKKK